MALAHRLGKLCPTPGAAAPAKAAERAVLRDVSTHRRQFDHLPTSRLPGNGRVHQREPAASALLGAVFKDHIGALLAQQFAPRARMPRSASGFAAPTVLLAALRVRRVARGRLRGVARVHPQPGLQVADATLSTTQLLTQLPLLFLQEKDRGANRRRRTWPPRLAPLRPSTSPKQKDGRSTSQHSHNTWTGKRGHANTAQLHGELFNSPRQSPRFGSENVSHESPTRLVPSSQSARPQRSDPQNVTTRCGRARDPSRTPPANAGTHWRGSHPSRAIMSRPRPAPQARRHAGVRAYCFSRRVASMTTPIARASRCTSRRLRSATRA